MTKEEIAILKEVLNPLLGDILGKLKNLEEKVDAALMANARDYLKVKEVADECGVTVQSIHWHLSHKLKELHFWMMYLRLTHSLSQIWHKMENLKS